MIDAPAKFHCRHCQAELGLTDGLRLLIAAVINEQILVIEFRDRTKPYCGHCGKLTVWYPRQSQAKNASANINLAVV